jgi:hypothetical protein
MNKLIASSVDPKELSLTLKGILVGIVPVAMLVIRAAGAEVSQDQVQQVVIVVSDVVTALGVLASAVMVAAGVIRKVVRAFLD